MNVSQCQRYPVHLCQPDEEKSCGACCGLYNWENHARATLKILLQGRRELFFSLQEPRDWDAYSRMCEALTPSPKLCDTIYNCEFLGFLDSREKRVGCLIHPSLHNGVDLRTCSFYGAKLCDEHVCPSFNHLTTVEQQAVVLSIHDWYLYGLVITDIDFVKEFFRHVQDRLGDSVHVEGLRNSKIRQALQDFFVLKERWPFLSEENRLGKYYFSHSEYRIARIDYKKKWGMKPSRFDKIFVSLSSAFRTGNDILEAEAIIEEKIRKFVRVWGQIFNLDI